MTYQEIYKLHYSKLVRNSILKSLVFGALCGFVVATVIAFVTVFTDFNGLWIALGSLVAVTAIVTVTLYFICFRPNEQKAIEKLDRLGFDERFITMRELEGDNSVIANMQRADAVGTLTDAFTKSGTKALKPNANGFVGNLRALGLSLGWTIAAVAMAAVSIVTLVITGLPSTRQDIISAIHPTPSFSVNYSSGSNGFLHDGAGYEYPGEGKTVSSFIQSIEMGGASMQVVAEAFNMFDLYNRYIDMYGVEALEDFELVCEYYFKGWSDEWLDENGNPNPSRSDKNVTGDVNASAIYGAIDIPVDLPKGSSGGSGGDEGGNPGEDSNAPPNPNKSDSNGNDKPSEVPPPGGDGDGAGGSITSNNGEVIDGVTDYREIFEQYYDSIMQMLADGQELPPELRKIAETYISALK